MENINTLRNKLRHELIDLDPRITRSAIAEHFGETLSTVSMALNGRRKGPKYFKLLQNIEKHLDSLR